MQLLEGGDGQSRHVVRTRVEEHFHVRRPPAGRFGSGMLRAYSRPCISGWGGTEGKAIIGQERVRAR